MLTAAGPVNHLVKEWRGNSASQHIGAAQQFTENNELGVGQQGIWLQNGNYRYALQRRENICVNMP
jgi:hypothetical protein